MATSRFDAAAIAAARKDLVIGVRAGDGSHRFTAVWAVVVEGRVFARSWGRKTNGWQAALRKDPYGTVQIGGREFAIRAVRTRSERLKDAVDAGYRAKYHTPASLQFVQDLTSPECRETTTEFVPLAT